jgi:hypothetical protein
LVLANPNTRLIALTLAATISLAALVPQAMAQQNYSQQQQPTQKTPLLKGQASYCVPQGTPIKLKIAATPVRDLKMMDRDLDGNLVPAKLGEEITAKIAEDLYVDDNKVIPEGSEFHGRVSKILAPRRVRRPGSLVIEFDRLKTPDGRVFAFQAQADNMKASTVKTKAKGFGIIAAHAAGGAIVGAMVAYQLFGLHETIAMHGYNIAGAAAGGALIATGVAIMKKGPKATLEPGDDLNMSFDSDLLMPAAVEPHKKHIANLAGLTVKINKTKMCRDGLGGNMLRMDVTVENDTDRTLASSDLFLEDSNGNRNPLVGGPEEDSEFLFDIDPHTEKQARLYFEVQWPKLKRQLVWLNHDTRKIAYRQVCP